MKWAAAVTLEGEQEIDMSDGKNIEKYVKNKHKPIKHSEITCFFVVFFIFF